MNNKPLLFLLLLAVFAASQSTLYAPAVDAAGNGILTTLEARAVAGSGGVFIDVEPYISVDTQESARTAVRIAAGKAGVSAGNYDVLYKIVADAEIVDGPSGGAALTLLAYAEFTGRAPRGDIAMTGTIERDGSIGKVAGISDKLDAVRKAGIKLFVVPFGQSRQGGVDLAMIAQREFNIQMAEARNFDELLAFAYSPDGSRVNSTASELPQLRLDALNSSLESQEFKKIVSSQRNKLAAAIAGLNASDAFAVEARRALNDSDYLLERGYYYSAANVVFTMKVALDAQRVQNYSKADFVTLVNALDGRVNAFRPANKTLENWQWVSGSQARFAWASLNVQDLQDSLALKQPRAMAEDYASALNWLDAADDLNAVAAQKGAGAALDEFAARGFSQGILGQANAVGDRVAAGADADIDWHLDAARQEFSGGDYLTSVFDSCFVISYYESGEAISNAIGQDDFDALKPDASAYGQMQASLWAELYYAHALYDSEEANRTGEFAYLTNAVKLRYLSECLRDKSANALVAIANPTALPSASPLPSMTVSAEITQDYGRDRWISLVGVLLLAAVIVILALAVKLRFSRQETGLTDDERMRRLDDLLLKGKISEAVYERLSSRYGRPAKRRAAAKAAPRNARKTRKK